MEIGHDVKASLSIYMQTNDVIGFTYTLKNTKVSLTSLYEPSGSNIFHDIADCVSRESSLLQYLEILTTEFNDRYFDEAPELIKNMLNIPAGREMYTPLMLAVRRNRRKLLKELVQLGGNYQLKDMMGQTLVHIAAANGFEGILVYLCMVLRMPYDETEMNSRTPLHLAALENQPSTGMLLISMTDNLDQQDVEGFTALHLSALSQCYKMVRNLIIMGASKEITDFKNQKPLDIALSRADIPIIKLLKNRGFCSYLNPFHQSIGPVSGSYKKMVIFMLASLFRAGVIVCYILPHMDIYILGTSIGLFFISGLGFFICAAKDPGYTKNVKDASLIELYETYRHEFICVYCEIRKPRHARHCHYCKRCVKEFDHHCPWINNCVGKNNHFWFMVFLTFSIFDYTFQGVVGVLDFFGWLKEDEIMLSFIEIPEWKGYVDLVIAGASVLFLLLVLPIWAIQILNFIKTPKRPRAESRPLVRHNTGSFGEMSDTGSMLLMPSSEWNPSAFQNPSSFLLQKDDEEGESCCSPRQTKESSNEHL